MHARHQDFIFTSQLPEKKTWNGIITRIELHYWKANSSVPDTSRVVVLNNVSMTTATLTNLSRYDTYAVVVQMCTRVGCGPRSQLIFIVRQDKPGSFCLDLNNSFLHRRSFGYSHKGKETPRRKLSEEHY